MSFGRILQRNRHLHILITIGVGVSSGVYLFQDPLRLYWQEQAAKQEAQAEQGSVYGRKGAEAPSLVEGVEGQSQAKKQP